MVHRFRWLAGWLAINLVLLFGIPALYGWRVGRMVQDEYRLGLRTSTDGDSLGIPIGGAFLMMLALLLVLNTIIFVVWRFRHRSIRKSA